MAGLLTFAVTSFLEVLLITYVHSRYKQLTSDDILEKVENLRFFLMRINMCNQWWDAAFLMERR